MLAQNTDNLSGQQIDHYKLEQLLANHEHSMLYLAHDTQTEQAVLLEIANASAQEDRPYFDAFQHNMAIVQILGHPNIATVTHIGQSEEDKPYVVMENTPGTTLEFKLAEWARENRSMPVVKALELVRDLATTLNVAHQAGLVHHALRPANIFLRENLTPLFVDLGLPYIAKETPPTWEPGQNIVIDYISPEQSEGKEITPRSNIYSLGVILYELLAGHAPKLPATSWDIFDRDATPKEIPLEEARVGLASETYRLVRNCLWRQEWSRYENANELVSAIDAAIAAEKALPKVSMPTTQSRRWLPIAIPLAVVLVALAIFFVDRNNRTNASTDIPVAEVTPVNTATNTPTATATATSTPTRTPIAFIPVATETPTIELVIELLEPNPNSSYTVDETITFDWRWPAELSAGQHFAIYLVSGTDVTLISTVKEPILGLNYRVRVPVSDLTLTEENSAWQVILETVATGESVYLSELRPIQIQIITETATPTATATPTITPTVACVPRQPSGWVSYRMQSGDSLFNLALAGGVSLDFVLEINCLPEDAVLSVGQRVFIPVPPATETPTPAPAQPTTPSGSGGGGGGGDRPQPTSAPPTPPP